MPDDLGLYEEEVMRRLRRREQPGDELYRCPRCKGKGPWVWGFVRGMLRRAPGCAVALRRGGPVELPGVKERPR